MAKTLILGRAGAGKTRLAMEEVARRVRAGTDAGALLLVPTYGRGEHLKRSLLSLLPGDEPFLPDRSIVTFTSLAERVLGGTAINALATAGARDLRLRRALAAVDAPVFREVAAFPGFRERFLGLVKEVKEAGLGPGETERALADLLAATAGGAARARLAGFVEVFRAYRGILEGDHLVDHEDFQRDLLVRLRSGEGKGAAGPFRNLEILLVDGFVNFTALQRDVVDLLAGRAAEAVATLPDDPERPDLYAPCRETRDHFLAKGWRPERLGEPRRFAAGDLRRVEATIFADAVPEPAPADGSVLLLRCADSADEADRVARRAALWIRRDGWRPEEILLVWRSLSGVRSLLEEAFARHGVPLRVFVARPLAAEPVVRAAVDLLRLAFGAGDGEGALRAVRSGFLRGADAAEGDRLAEELERRGTPGEAAEVLAVAEGLGLEGTAALLRSLLPADAAAAADSPRAARALALEALASFDAGTRLLPEWERGSPDAGRAAAEAAALTALGDLVAEVARGRSREGEGPVAPAAFLAAVEEALARAAFQPLDRRLHAVNAVDVVEARQWEARGVIVGGLLEKRFPRAPREDLFLRDRERKKANEAGGLRFAERLRGREEERLLFHVACTRARERLVLSWPAAGAGGERLLHSSFLDEVLRLWPADARPLSESRLSDPAPLPGEVLAAGDLLRGALVRVAAPCAPGSAGEGEARRAAALLDALAAREKGRRLRDLARAAALAAPPEAVLRGRRLRGRFLRPFRTSASALADLHQCAYKHFASRLLGLRSPERDAEEGLDPLRVGTLVHGTLEEWLKGGRRRDPGAIFDELLAASAAGARAGLGDRATAIRAREAVAAFARAEGERIDNRPWTPTLFEHGFGLDPDGAPALRFAAGRRRVEVRGVFDRVDLAPGGGAVVVDYKNRAKGAPYDADRHEEALAGKDPQVPLYWLAAARSLGREPAGVEIAEVGTLDVTGLRAAAADGTVAPDGAVVLDEAAAAGLRDRLEEMLAAAVGGIDRGEIPARPVDEDRCGAGACDFADLCRYEKWRRG